MASSSLLLSPLSSTTATTEKNSLSSTASAFLQNPKLLFAAKPRNCAVRRCGFKCLAKKNPLDRIPKQFREENLAEGLMENYKNFPPHLYGLNPAQMDMFMTEDNIFSRQAERVTPESISARQGYRNSGGILSVAEMKKRGSVASAYRGGGGGGYRRPRSAPPDLPSCVLDSRVVYLGMPIVGVVAQLIMSQIVWLDYDDPTKPIYLYINSSGTQNQKGEIVGSESDAFMIIDILNFVQPQVYTVNISQAYGQAALLLSMGAKGYRALLPNSITKLHLPKDQNSSGSSSDLWIKKTEIERSSRIYLELLSKGVDKSVEELHSELHTAKYFTAQMAIDYGVADRIITPEDQGFESRDYRAMAEQSKAQRIAAARGGGPQPSSSGYY